MRSIVLFAAATAFACTATPAAAQKGLGPAYNMKYKSEGIVATDYTTDNAIEWTAEDIYTINCGGCSTVWYGPGTIFHLRNTTKIPLCASFEFTPEDPNDWIVHRWGSGTAYYLKPGQRMKKVGGLYTVSTGEGGTANLRYTYTLRRWSPAGKNRC